MPFVEGIQVSKSMVGVDLEPELFNDMVFGPSGNGNYATRSPRFLDFKTATLDHEMTWLWLEDKTGLWQLEGLGIMHTWTPKVCKIMAQNHQK